MKAQIFGFVLLLTGCSQGGALPTPGTMPEMPTMPSDGGVVPPDLLPAVDQALPFAEGKPLWGRSYASETKAVTTAPDGSIYLAGQFNRADFGDGQVTSKGITDVFLIKFDKNGQRLWARTFGRDYIELTKKVVADKAGNVAVVGSSLRTADTATHDAFVAYYTSDGTQRYFRIYGGPLDTAVDGASDAAFAADGSLYVTGGFSDRINLGGGELVSAGSTDGFFLHLSATGTHLLSQRFGFTSGDAGLGLSLLPDGDLFMSGIGGYPIDFGDGMVGTDPTVDTFLVRYSPQGVARWSKRLKIGSGSSPKSVAAADGSLWLVGDTGKTVDLGGGPLTSATALALFTAHYSGTGAHLGSYLINSVGGLYVNAVAVDHSGQVIVGGKVYDDVNFGFGKTTDANGSAFFFKQAPTGQVRWAYRYGGTYVYDAVEGIAVSPDNQVLVGGGLSQNIMLGSVSLGMFTYLLALTP